MARVKKGGRELVVADSELAEYLKLGYSAVDDKGNVLTRSMAMTFEQAMAENAALNAKMKIMADGMEKLHTEKAGIQVEYDKLLSECIPMKEELDGLREENQKLRKQLESLNKPESTANRAQNTLEPSQQANPNTNQPKRQSPVKAVSEAKTGKK